MTDYIINHIDPVNLAALDGEMRAQFGVAITGVSARAGMHIIIHFVDEPTAQQQTDAQTVLTAHDPDAETPLQVHKGLIAALLTSFNGNGAEAEYFINLQSGLETVLTNGTPLATFFPAMLNNLQAVPAYYQGYINLLEESTTVTQANIEAATPTAAQMRAAYNAAMFWKDAGMWRVLLAALNKKLLTL